MERISYNEVPKGMFDVLMSVENYVNNAPIDLQLLELIRYRAAILNGCSYCVDMHSKELKHIGETDVRLHAVSIWNSTPYFSEKEQSILAFTDAITHTSYDPIPEELFQNLTKYFTKEEIAYLTLAIAQINSWTRLMKSFKFTPGNYKVSQNEK
ncbi:carboxymuconolactone decarboxylase family protein [Tenacibaculum aiptasiae]|uniref:Carboxymuconolactone decarboxylase family protein n=1 Tax=Tenacibaculum aiptasiae TaxID=426481 RepID=A0A7J5A8M1_9FLAO|nr:carboxymuconolactone decarboxylase family protein [Tenacibaculum aiptasiae]KAB1153910.1 carboxymuconolactone decarboxylase family protein [Tenacibaculum aiptasiae]